VSCISQENLKTMLERAYRGPNSFTTDCNINGAVQNLGNFTVTATNVDPITCDIMKDSTVGFADKCIPNTNIGVVALIAAGISLPAIALLTYSLYKCVDQYREEKLSMKSDYQRTGYYTI